MELKGEALLVRVFLGEADKVRHTPLYEAIVRAAREAGLAGATVWGLGRPAASGRQSSWICRRICRSCWRLRIGKTA